MKYGMFVFTIKVKGSCVLDGEIVLLLTNVSPNTYLPSNPPTMIIDIFDMCRGMAQNVCLKSPLIKTRHLYQLMQSWTRSLE